MRVGLQEALVIMCAVLERRGTSRTQTRRMLRDAIKELLDELFELRTLLSYPEPDDRYTYNASY